MGVCAQDQIALQRRPASAVLVGRETELAVLRDAVSNPPALVTLVGEAGIGKSRLVRELLEENPGDGCLLLGRCHQVRDPFPLGPVVEALRAVAGDVPARSLSPLVGALRPLLPELSRCLPDEPAPLADPRAQRHRTFRALRELLDALGATGVRPGGSPLGRWRDPRVPLLPAIRAPEAAGASAHLPQRGARSGAGVRSRELALEW